MTIRIIEGKSYELYMTCRTKANANENAKKYKRLKVNYRIIKLEKGYGLFIMKGIGKGCRP